MSPLRHTFGQLKYPHLFHYHNSIWMYILHYISLVALDNRFLSPACCLVIQAKVLKDLHHISRLVRVASRNLTYRCRAVHSDIES